MRGETNSRAARVRSFFSERIWDERPIDLHPAKAALYRVSRIGYTTVQGFFEHRLTVRAAALTYYSVLSVVPFLAFAFAILKGFGAYRTFIQGTVQPYLTKTFGPNRSLYEAIERILGFVDKTDFSRVGAVGLVLLVYTSVSLVSSVEAALSDVFGAKTTRPFVRQITDYVTLLVTTPLLVLAAGTFSAAAQSSTAVEFLRDQLKLGPLIDLGVDLAPIVVIGLGLFAMYLILPNVRTRPLSAAIGAGIAAIAWQGALVLHVQLQMGVARANAIYSVLGAVPIFLVWTYVAWEIVLVGAEIAASHQNEQLVRQRLHDRHADQALKETLAVAVGAHVAREFLDGHPHPTATDLATSLELPVGLVTEILDALVRAGVLVRAASERDLVYVPGRDVDALRASDLRDALRRDPRADDVRASVERQLGPRLRQVLLEAELERRRSPSDLTLRELAALASDAGPPRDPDAHPRADGGEDVRDAGEPRLPA